MRNVVDRFNAWGIFGMGRVSVDPAECRCSGVNPGEKMADIGMAEFPGPFPISNHWNKGASGSCVREQHEMREMRAFFRAGKLKTREACLRKLVEYADDPVPVSRILDVVRGTVVFACPCDLALFFAFLESEFAVVRVKNRFASPIEGSFRDVLLNFRFQQGGLGDMIVELQLSLEPFDAMKKFLHNTYKVLRCDSPDMFQQTERVFGPPEDAAGSNSAGENN